MRLRPCLAYKPNVMLDFAKLDVSSMLTGISTQSLLGDPDFLEALDEIFTQLPESELLLAEASDELKPFISFEHNETARRMLQVKVVVSILSAMIIVYSIASWAALASAFGTPSAKKRLGQPQGRPTIASTGSRTTIRTRPWRREHPLPFKVRPIAPQSTKQSGQLPMKAFHFQGSGTLSFPGLPCRIIPG